MSSISDIDSYEFQPKRIKISINDDNDAETCKQSMFSCFSATIEVPMDSIKDITDCDAVYDASSMGSIPTVSQHSFPQIDPDDLQDTLSTGNYFNRPTDNGDCDEEEEEQRDPSNNSNNENLELEDDDTSSESYLSELSDVSGQEWKPISNSVSWVQQQIQNGVNPRTLLKKYGVDLDHIPQYIKDMTLWKFLIEEYIEPLNRPKLSHVNTLEDVVTMLKSAQKIIVLTGAGVSVSCGIPDFRSKDGIYSRLAMDFPNLRDPQSMFDINFFYEDPRPFFKFAKDIYPGKFRPSPCHRFIKLLEKNHKLLRNYTQNIDTLEKEANIERVVECHGSFATATCTKCKHEVDAAKIRDIVLAQQIPLCEVCNENTSVATGDLNGEGTYYKNLVNLGIMKPNIVFFGESMPDSFHKAMTDDKPECDLLLVIGSSLKVRPVAFIPKSIPPDVPQILINREPLPNFTFDVELLGDCDIIINHICKLLGENWEKEINLPSSNLTEAPELLPEFDHISYVNKWQEANDVEQDDIHLEPEEEHKCECECETQQLPSTVAQSYQIESKCECNLTAKTIKERHISVDSARDSGISENSNLTDIESESKESTTMSNLYSPPNENDKKVETTSCFDEQSQDTREFWQSKVKRSLAERLPRNSFHLLQPSRYIFPGAEVYYDPDDKSSLSDDDSSLDISSDC